MVILGISMLSRIADVYNPFLPAPSEAVLPGEVAYAIIVPLGAFINAKPLPDSERVQLLSKGLFLQASRIIILTFTPNPPLELISCQPERNHIPLVFLYLTLHQPV